MSIPIWNQTNREESKPSHLNVVERRFTFRSNEGWVTPTQFVDGTIHGSTLIAYGSGSSIPTTELLVTLPLDPSVAGVTNADFANLYTNSGLRTEYPRRVVAGQTASGETAGNNYSPFFTCPFNGDSATAGGPEGSGVSHGSWKDTLPTGTYLNRREVSSLHVPYGATSYVKVLANDPNFTNNLTVSFVEDVDGLSGFAGSDLLDTTKVPLDVFKAFFGATAYGTNGLGVVVVGNGVTTGDHGVTAQVFDGFATGNSEFTITVA